MNFQQLILSLQTYWAGEGCLLQQPYDLEVGAGTFNPATLLDGIGHRAVGRCLRRTVSKTHGPDDMGRTPTVWGIITSIRLSSKPPPLRSRTRISGA